MEVNGWLHKQGTSIQGDNISVFLDLTICNWPVIPDITKNIVTVIFNSNQSINKISYLGLEGNPISLVSKLTA
jgi:hypothetical protein